MERVCGGLPDPTRADGGHGYRLARAGAARANLAIPVGPPRARRRLGSAASLTGRRLRPRRARVVARRNIGLDRGGQHDRRPHPRILRKARLYRARSCSASRAAARLADSSSADRRPCRGGCGGGRLCRGAASQLWAFRSSRPLLAAAGQSASRPVRRHCTPHSCELISAGRACGPAFLCTSPAGLPARSKHGSPCASPARHSPSRPCW